MIVYQASKKEFSEDVINNLIEKKILDSFQFSLGRTTSQSEIDSWKNSMVYMNNILLDPLIPHDSQVSIEFQIPLTSKRIDFIISGTDENKNENVIIIELKQWQKANITAKDGIVSTRFKYGVTDTAHPSYQAWSYKALLDGFNKTVYEESIMIKPCAYLHNYESDEVITNDFYREYLKKAPVFLKSDVSKLRDFIKRYIKYGDHSNIMYRIDHGKIKPSKQLADGLASMLKGNQEFILIDDQKIVFETAKQLASHSSDGKTKNVLIVEGGPGTGKSVVAINLLVELTKKGLVCQYVTKNSAPRAVYASKLTGTLKKTQYNNLFKGSGSYIDSKENTFDVLIVDEAHRLNLKSGLFSNLGENQALEIMSASKCSIFFVDDRQKIHIKDIGTKRKLEIWAEQEGANVTQLKLESQFRCNGSDGYLAWLDDILEIKQTPNKILKQDDYDFRIFDDPLKLKEAITERNMSNNKSRMVAGYCWDWLSKKNPNAFDIEFPEYGFKMQWNLTKDGSNWLIAKNSINEIGCIHTCQGLELDYVGVIIGNDLRIENNKIITDVGFRSKNDQSIRGIKKMMKEDSEKAKRVSEEIIKNTYRTLMTRGMKGCYVYFQDEILKEYFSERIQSVSKPYNLDQLENNLGKAAESKIKYNKNKPSHDSE